MRRSSHIQTVLSVSESHRFCAFTLADFTAGRESHPALKIYEVFFTIPRSGALVKGAGV